MSKKQKPAIEDTDSEFYDLDQPDEDWEDDNAKSVSS